MKHIYLDKLFLFFLIIIILTGNVKIFIIYFVLIIIHELGHTLCGMILGYRLEKIIIYPYGGITIFNYPLNIPLKEELLILVMGPLMQVVGYLFLKEYYDIKLLHYSLLIFNLLPIYPLDGGKILNIICNYCFNYLKSFYITFIISIIFIMILLIYNLNNFNLNFMLILLLMLKKLLNIYQKRYFYYQRFLLERYLSNYNFKKIKNITSIKLLYRDRKHFINFMHEREYLDKYFKK